MEENEKTPNGDPIYRYKIENRNEFNPPSHSAVHLESITNHIEKNIGRIHSVFHEIISDQVHVDVHWVKPTKDFPLHVLITSGMSDKAMNVPEGLEEHQYAELCILLPEEWKIESELGAMKNVFADEDNYWPVRWLKIIARFPHEYNTWVGWGHTIPNGEYADPFSENTKLGCMLLYPSISLAEDFFELKLSDKTIRFYCLIPIFREEMEFKLNNGTDALIDIFSEQDVSDIVEKDRHNTCA